jgi:hypothetical protein
MKHILFLAFLFSSFLVFSQDGQEWKEASKESQDYHEYRIKPTVPPYGLAKIKELIKQIKKSNAEEETEAISQKTYDALSLREKFTYNMIHAESYSQNCDAMPPIQNEQKKIFAYIADAFDEYEWSDRQTKFLTNNRDSVIAFMKESISRTKRVGVNFKQAILEINAREMIPFLIATYNITKKDHDILTIFLQLMKDNEYEAFLISGSYKKLYSEDSNYQAFLNFNAANESLIIKRATDFYNAGKN